MKNLYLIFFILILVFCTGFSDSVINVSVSYQPAVERLEQIFKSYMPVKQGIIYTKVPRGLIISIDENQFFSTGDARLKESSLYILDTISFIVEKLKNDCVIESHTQQEIPQDRDYKEFWEISTARAQNIADYMVFCRKVPFEKVFPMGFGELMPFKDNVSTSPKGFDNRVDFVIIEYEAKR